MKVEIDIPDELLPATRDLVRDFATALAKKLTAAQAKRAADGIEEGHEWNSAHGWEYECNLKLVRHVGKGDPLDVAAYAAFCWARGWRTSLRSVMTMLSLDPGLR